MGRRGPSPTPTNLRLLQGETRPSRLNLNEPIPPEGLAEPPEFLSVEAVAVWESLAPTLTRMGLLTLIDAHQFAVYCDAVAQYERASNLVAQTGLLIRGRKDATVKNPAMQLVRDLAQTIKSYAQEFGLTPSARSMLSVGDREEQRGGAERLLS